MASKFKIEKEDGKWLILMPCEDGITDIISEHDTRAEALAEKRRIEDEDAAIAGAERHYQAQYAYACGYHD